MKWIAAGLLIGTLWSCNSVQTDYPRLDYKYLFSDGNCKVWLVDDHVLNSRDMSNSRLNKKDLFLFYESGKCVFVPMNQLGQISGLSGEYDIDTRSNSIHIQFPNEEWFLNIETINEDEIILTPYEENSPSPYLRIIPLPEDLNL